MNAQIKITYRDKDGNIIENPTDGEKAYSPETKRLYQWSAAAGEWQLIDGDINLGMTMYDLNKQIISQLPALDADGLDKAMKVLDMFVNELEQTYFMMLCREMNYYTLFKVDRGTEVTGDLEGFSAEVLDCALDLGVLKSVERVEDTGAIEIWIEPTKDEDPSEPVVMYLFPYDAGVIECTL